MLIFTNKDLQEEVLESNVYRNIYDNYKNYKKGKDTLLNTLKGLGPQSISWTTWFKNNKNLCEFLNKMGEYKEQKNTDLIPYNIYKALIEFLELEKNSNDATIKPLISILKEVLKKEVVQAIGVVDFCLNSPSFKGHRGLCQNILSLSLINDKRFYSNERAIKAMKILLEKLIELVDSEENREKLAKDSNSEALKSIELAFGRVAMDTSNPFHIRYATLVRPYLGKVQDTLKEHGSNPETNFKMD